MEIGTADVEVVADLGIGDGVEAHTKDGIGMGVEIAASDIMEDEEEFEAEASAGGTTEIARQLEAGQLMASGEKAGLTDRTKRLGLENLKVRALLCIERARVDSLRHYMALSHEEFRQICRDRDDARRRLRRCDLFVERHLGFRPYQNGNDGDNGNGGNGNGNPELEETTKMEIQMRMVERSYEVDDRSVLSKERDTEMETELWNLTVKKNDLAAYTQRFQELTLLCTRMVPEKKDRIKRYEVMVFGESNVNIRSIGVCI
ncbi:hypothetical protein Tco_1341131 [Tanacetum coccineum]